MDAQQKGWVGPLLRLAQRDRRLTVAVSTVALLGIFAVASAMPHDASAAQSASDALTPAVTVIATPPTSTPPPHQPAQATVPVKTAKIVTTPVTAPQHASRAHAATPTAVPATPTPAVTATPSEAQTPLKLSDPTTADTALATPPWWQSLFDMAWKLALVVALIYLAMRGLAAFKNAGFTTNGKHGLVKLGGKHQQFFEQIEEIRLSPQHTLHAVRAGNRIIMLARSGSTLRPLSEVEIGDLEADALSNLATEGFGQQLMSAWTGIMPPHAEADASKADVAATPELTTTTDAQRDNQAGVIDAKWVMVAPEAAPTATAHTDAAPLPTKPGKARPSDRPEPLDEATTREVLWFAEEHGVSAAAERFGLTHQRVTAMRARYERARAVRRREQQRAEDREQAGITRTSPARTTRVAAPHLPARPDHPRDDSPSSSFRPLASSANLISSAYGKPAASATTKPVITPAQKPDVTSTNDPIADVAATAIAQALASRFGVRMDNQDK